MKLLFISLTFKCDRYCSYCPVKPWRHRDDELTLENTIKFIGKAKPDCVEITGGEPTLVPWLWDLCDWLETNGIAYLVKSNGYKRCKHQITAWHDGIDKPPENYDKILIIKDTPEWELKQSYCEEHSIQYGVIEFGDKPSPPLGMPIQQLFLCPDGHVKMCHEHETPDKVSYIGDDEFTWVFTCPNCKSVNDFVLFIENP